MIVKDLSDRGMGRIGGADQLEGLDEFAAAVAILPFVRRDYRAA
jgi:hypothetical protein